MYFIGNPNLHKTEELSKFHAFLPFVRNECMEILSKL